MTLAAMVAANLPSVTVNASSTPTPQPTLLGGFAGALLLLSTPATAFDRIVPWLLLVATLTLAAGPRLGARLLARRPGRGWRCRSCSGSTAAISAAPSAS